MATSSLSKIETTISPLSASSPWQIALHNATENLSEKDRAWIIAPRDAEDLTRLLVDLQSSSQKGMISRILSRLEPFTRLLKSFTQIITVFVSANPAIAAPIWGTVMVLVELVSRSTSTIEKLVDTLNDIGLHLPRFEMYAEIFPGQTRLEAALIRVYADFIGFGVLGIAYFRRKTIVNLFRSVWSSFEVEFTPIISRLKYNGKLVDTEAVAASVLKGAQRHQELVKLLERDGHHGSLQQFPCHVIRYSEPLKFQGRTEILRQVHDKLSPTQDQSTKRLVLSGIGGVGKTQIALRYAYNHLDVYPAIFWISAETETRLIQDFHTIAITLALDPAIESMKPERAGDLTLQWLRNTETAWLVVFDNVEDVRILQPYWPRTSKGSVLLTSRYPALSESLSASMISVQPFNEIEGAKLLLSLTTDTESDLSLAIDISGRLGGLALGLVHVASFLRETECCLEEFREIYDSRCDQIEVNAVDTRQALFQYERSLSTAWDLSVTTLGSRSRLLLDLMFFYDPDAIPEILFRKGAEQVNETELAFLKSNASFLSTISRLFQRSLVQRNAKTHILSLHRLIQLEACRTWQQDVYQIRFDQAASLLANAFPPHHSGQPMTNAWGECSVLVPHVLSLARRFETDSFLKAPSSFIDLMNRCGWYLYEIGQHPKSIQFLKLAETICINEHSDSLLQADAYRGIAQNYKNLNRLAAAEEYVLKFLQIRRRHLSDDHLETADAWTDYGVILNCQDKFEETLDAYTRAIGTERADLACPAGLLAQSYSCLGRLLTRIGRYQEAGELLEEALEINVKRSYIHLFHLGNLRLAQKDLDGALKIHLEALIARRDALGPNAPYTGLSFHKVAAIRHMQGATTEAIDLLREALLIFDPVPELNADSARTTFKLSELLAECGNQSEATRCRERARRLRETVTGSPSSPDETFDMDYDPLTAFDGR